MSRNGKARTAPVLLEGSYYARITKQRGGGYLVEFPDLSGCLTEGKDLKTALANAREALSGWDDRHGAVLDCDALAVSFVAQTATFVNSTSPVSNRGSSWPWL